MNRRPPLTLLWYGPVNRTTCAAIAHGDTAVIYLHAGRMWWRYTQPMPLAQVSRWWTHCLPEPLSAVDTSRAIDRLIRTTHRSSRHRLTGAVL